MSFEHNFAIAIPPDAYNLFCEHKIGQKHPQIEILKGNQQAMNRELARMWAEAIRNNHPEVAAFEAQADRTFQEDFAERLLLRLNSSPSSEAPQPISGPFSYLVEGSFGFAFLLFYVYTCSPLRGFENKIWHYYYHILPPPEQAICDARGKTMAKVLKLCGQKEASKVLHTELFSYLPLHSVGNAILQSLASSS